MLIATTLTLMMMGAVAQLFEAVGKGITGSRSLLEMSDRLRLTVSRLREDVRPENLTVPKPIRPPLAPGGSYGYFQYTEGPIGPVVRPEALFRNADTNSPDTTVTDNDDMLMFTVHSNKESFVGRYRQPLRNNQGVIVGYNNTTVRSHDAEIAWFVRGRTLYRRVLLIVPNLDLGNNNRATGVADALNGFYRYNDISMHREFDNNGYPIPRANSLGDLTKPENRFAHQPRHMDAASPSAWLPRITPDPSPPYLPPVPSVRYPYFPYHPHFGAHWGQLGSNSSGWPPPFVPIALTNANASAGVLGGSRAWRALGLPTLRECSYIHPTDPTQSWPAGEVLPNITLTPRNASDNCDLWTNPNFWNEVDPDTGDLNAYLGPRIGEDVILSHVIGFDVKVWDPGAPIVTATDAGATQTVLLPGDPGYLYGLQNRGATVDGIAYSIADHGAYVDLNYMAPLGPMPSTSSVPYPNIPYRNPAYVPVIPQPPELHWAANWRSGVRGAEPFTKVNLNNPFDRGADVIDPTSQWIVASRDRAAVYDTWSTHYDKDGLAQFPIVLDLYTPSGQINPANDSVKDLATNGFDDPSYDPNNNRDSWAAPNGQVDDGAEAETSPPYNVALQGIQITIRVYEPGTHQVRQQTIRQNF